MSNINHKNKLETLFLNKDIDFLYEPVGRNTAPAILLASLFIKNKYTKDAIISIIPCDHLFDNDAFVISLNKACIMAKDTIVTFGIKPTYPETGFGYIKRVGNELLSFVEKPDLGLAKQYLEEGYLWNSGVFVFNCEDILNRYQSHDIIMYEASEKCLNKDYTINNKYNELSSISFDYCIMEHVTDGKVIEYNNLWSDVGTWKKIHDSLPQDNNGNQIKGMVQYYNLTNSYVNTQDLEVKVVGLDNIGIIENNGKLLIINLDQDNEIKKVL